MFSEVLVDSSFLVASGYPRDRHHERAKRFASAQSRSLSLLAPDVVLVEAMYNLQRLGGSLAVVTFANRLFQETPIMHLEQFDYLRAVQILHQ